MIFDSFVQIARTAPRPSGVRVIVSRPVAAPRSPPRPGACCTILSAQKSGSCDSLQLAGKAAASGGGTRGAGCPPLPIWAIRTCTG